MSESKSENPPLQYTRSFDPHLSFPTLPRTVTEVSRLLAEATREPDALELAEIVDKDPIVATAVLRRINSVYYGIRRRIGSVRKAVMLLGFLDVANVVLTAGMIRLEEAFASEDHAGLFEQVMRVSVGAGQYAREIAGLLDLPIQGQAYSAGLLHAVGRLVFLYNRPDKYAALWQRDGSRLPSIEAESAIFGINHAELGGQAADEWKLPPFIVEALRAYPHPRHLDDAEHRQIATLLAVAVSAIRQFGDGEPSEVNFDPPPQLVQLAEITGREASDIVEHIEQRQGRVRSFVSTMAY